MTAFDDPRGEPAVPYATNDLLPAAAVNTIVDNEIVTLRRSLSKWSVFQTQNGTGDNVVTRIPAYYAPWSSIFAVVSENGNSPFLFALNRQWVTTTPHDWTPLVAYSALDNGAMYVCAGMSSNGILMVRADASVTNWYIGQDGGATLSAHAFGAFGAFENFIASGPVLETVNSLGAPLFIVPGALDSTHIGLAVFPNGGARCTLEEGAEYLGGPRFLYRLASDDDGLIVGVGGKGENAVIVISDDYGTTWVWDDYPLPAAYYGTASPSIAYDAKRSVFVTTILDSDGKIVYCYSADGVSWSDWRRIPMEDAGTTIATTVDPAEIIIVGGIWITSRAFAPALSTAKLVQVWASHDGGATWFDISPGQGIDFTDGFWMVQLGNRVGISTASWFALSDEFDVETGIASEVVT